MAMDDPTRTPDLGDLSKGQQLDGADLLVASKEERTTKGTPPKPFYVIAFKNATGHLVARIWSEKMEPWQDVSPGDVVQVTGRVEEGFGGEGFQLNVTRAPSRVEDENHPLRDLLNDHYPGDVAELEARFRALVDRIEHPGCRLYLRRFFETACPWSDFRTAPAATDNHHNYIHGLLEHSVEVAEIAVEAAEKPGIRDHVNRDLLITAALIHDAGKVDEYQWKGVPIDFSPKERLYNHLTSGPLMAHQAFDHHREELEQEGFTERELDHLIHYQVSHHGSQEWGSPTPPRTPGAQILHQADMTSAHVRKITNMMEQQEPDPHGLYPGAQWGDFRRGIPVEPGTSDDPLAEQWGSSREVSLEEGASGQPEGDLFERALAEADEVADDLSAQTEEPAKAPRTPVR